MEVKKLALAILIAWAKANELNKFFVIPVAIAFIVICGDFYIDQSTTNYQ